MTPDEMSALQDKTSSQSSQSFLLENSKSITLSDLLKFSGRIKGDQNAAIQERRGRLSLTRKHSNSMRLPADQMLDVVSHQKDTGHHITHILVGRGIVREEDIVLELTTQHGFPYLPLENYEINMEAARLVPEGLATRHALIPVDKISNNLMVAMANPFDAAAIRDIEALTCCTVQIFVATVGDIKKATVRCYAAAKAAQRHEAPYQELV